MLGALLASTWTPAAAETDMINASLGPHFSHCAQRGLLSAADSAADTWAAPTDPAAPPCGRSHMLWWPVTPDVALVSSHLVDAHRSAYIVRTTAAERVRCNASATTRLSLDDPKRNNGFQLHVVVCEAGGDDVPREDFRSGGEDRTRGKRGEKGRQQDADRSLHVGHF